MSESLYFPKFERINHFQTVNFGYPLQSSLQPNLDNIKAELIDPTRDPTIEKQKHKTRSVKILADPLNISFQSPFMDEHKSCFLREFQKYMEHQQSYLGSQASFKLKRKTFQLNLNFNQTGNLPKIIRQYGSLLSQLQRQLLIIDLKRQDKLSEFLEFILNKVNEDSVKEIIYFVNIIWEEYIPFQDMNYSQQEAQQFSQSFIQKHIQKIDQKLSQINYKEAQKLNQGKKMTNQSKQRLNIFKKFSQFFITTIVMVIGGYFENPYTNSEQNYYKRELNELVLGYQNDDQYHDKDFESEEDEVIINKRIKR